MPTPFNTKMQAVLSMAADAIANSSTDLHALRVTCDLHRFLSAELQEREVDEGGTETQEIIPNDPPRPRIIETKDDVADVAVEGTNVISSTATYKMEEALNTVDGDQTITKRNASDPKLYETLMSADDTRDITRGEDPSSFAPRFVDMKLGFWFGRGIHSWSMEDDRMRVIHD